MLWPPVCALLATFGLTQAHRYWAAKEPDMRLDAFLERDTFFARGRRGRAGAGELIIPHLVGHRSPEVMWLVRIYLLNIPAALVQFLMIGLLEGSRRFGWAGSSRLITFVVRG